MIGTVWEYRWSTLRLRRLKARPINALVSAMPELKLSERIAFMTSWYSWLVCVNRFREMAFCNTDLMRYC